MSIDFNRALESPDTAPVVREDQPKPVQPDYKTMLETAKRGLSRYEEQIDRMIRQADGHPVRDDVTEREAVEMAGQAKKLITALETDRKKLIGDPDGFVRSINSLARGLKDRLTKIEGGLKRKITDYQQKLELDRRKAEAAARKAAAEYQAKLDAEAAAAHVEPVKVPPPVIPKKAAPVRTAEGTCYQHKEWTAEVEDLTTVPREYLEMVFKTYPAARANLETVLKKEVKQGVRKIDGVKIYEKSDTRIRS